MDPMPPKYHAPTLSVFHVVPQNQIASPMGYAGTQGISCFGDRVAIRVGPIPIALNFVTSVSNLKPPTPTPRGLVLDLFKISAFDLREIFFLWPFQTFHTAGKCSLPATIPARSPVTTAAKIPILPSHEGVLSYVIIKSPFRL